MTGPIPELPKTIRCSCGSTSFETFQKLRNVLSKKTSSCVGGEIRAEEQIESSEESDNPKPYLCAVCGKENEEINALLG